MKPFVLLFPFLGIGIAYAQIEKKTITYFDGIVVVGYVDKGGYLNFTGPNINVAHGKSKYIFGMMPSLRFKEDKGTPKNSLVVPSLGFGFTYSYKALAFQIPLYYNAKSAAKDGRWHVGAGLGLRLNWFNKHE